MTPPYCNQNNIQFGNYSTKDIGSKATFIGGINQFYNKSPTIVKHSIRHLYTPVHNNDKFRENEPIDYNINLENIILGKDKRTTLMLRHIPNKYTLNNLVEEINSLYLGKYDYINLPIDYEVFVL